MTYVSIRGLAKAYRARDEFVPALTDVNLQVRQGEFVSIVGPSGCGKSTLLYILGGFLRADEGLVEVVDAPSPNPASIAASYSKSTPFFPGLPSGRTFVTAWR